MSADGHRTKWWRKSSENFNRLSRAHERYRQTIDDRQTDGRTTTYSEHELEFTFAKNGSFFYIYYTDILNLCIFWCCMLDWSGYLPAFDRTLNTLRKCVISLICVVVKNGNRITRMLVRYVDYQRTERSRSRSVLYPYRIRYVTNTKIILGMTNSTSASLPGGLFSRWWVLV